MSGTGKLSRDQMEAWLILEGWQPWQATYDGKTYGIRKGDMFMHNGYGIQTQDRSEACLSTERKCEWLEIPTGHIRAYYKGLTNESR